MSKKEIELKSAIDQITTTFGKGSIMWLGRSVPQEKTPVVSTGSLALDIALGIGGLPKVSYIFMQYCQYDFVHFAVFTVQLCDKC